MAFVSASSNLCDYGEEFVVVTAPSGIEDNHILVALMVSWKDTSDQTHTLPSGFTTWYSRRCTGAHGSYLLWTLAWKRASSDSGNYTFTGSSGIAEVYAGISVYSGRIATGDPLDVGSSTTYETEDTTVRAASVTIATAGSDLVWAAWSETDSSPSMTCPSGMTSRISRDWTEIWSSLEFADLLNQSAGSTGDKDGTCDSFTGRKHACLVALKPAATGNPYYAYAQQ